MNTSCVITTDEVCGKFNFACNSGPVEFFRDNGNPLPFGSVSVYYDSGCADQLEVIVINSIGVMSTFMVPLRNTRSMTFPDIVAVQFNCLGAGMGNCLGNYCLTLHKTFPCPLCPLCPTEVECIFAKKVYDRVALGNSLCTPIDIPEVCLIFAEQAIEMGQKVTVTCTLPNVASILPLTASHNVFKEDQICCQILKIVPIAKGSIVTILFIVPVILTFTNNQTLQSQSCTIHIRVKEEVVLCIPNTTRAKRSSCKLPDGCSLICKISDPIQCSVSSLIIEDGVVDNQLFIDLSFCKQILVFCEVILEVPAKFCRPRGPVPIPPLQQQCSPKATILTQCQGCRID